MKLRAYHLMPENFDLTPVCTVHAKDIKHAIEKISALHGIEANARFIWDNGTLLDERRLIKECMEDTRTGRADKLFGL